MVPFAENDDVVEAISAEAAKESCAHGVLERRLIGVEAPPARLGTRKRDGEVEDAVDVTG